VAAQCAQDNFYRLFGRCKLLTTRTFGATDRATYKNKEISNEDN